MGDGRAALRLRTAFQGLRWVSVLAAPLGPAQYGVVQEAKVG